ncbi:MAG: phosphoribosylformylglycinamidine cyclo-ligase [Candidatus Eremiobacter antarcticus]|nr:phosphoribosylformylglycinamidine cyclo-ligase [Candidatus Eremiobacteraeota bacterium]MBC5809056.1 phosphoribosylformylglycinamidine cyclo-ligase [Candidatus Eremiobacteraeota bacterium]PZR64288.1 MAG: phosphoribosylformylglycinamidine cyclo-ligase [Candidatus Eremiobacter sp. RRmetagenome_bin22]
MTDAYRAAGVDIDAAARAVDSYRQAVGPERDERVLQGIGGFAGCFALRGYRDAVLVASCDGVGTKVLIAAQLGRYESIGKDLVHHCINDVLCSNAEALFFLDYLAMGKLTPALATEIVKGVAHACRQNGVALLGGETAEMPDVYAETGFDLAGTLVGAVERDELVDVSQVGAGDLVIGLPSNGLHTNGYSLARAMLPVSEWGDALPGAAHPMTVGDALLAVHPCYAPCIRAMQASGARIKSMAHITGGGIFENLPRALPDHLAARLQLDRLTVPPIVQLVATAAHLHRQESYRVLNMGVGFCCVLAPQDAQRGLEAARQACERDPIEAVGGGRAEIIGEIEPRHPCGPSVIID